MTPAPCEFCRIGYHAPFDRFVQIGARDDGPQLLWRCQRCGMLWLENPRTVRSVDEAEAEALFGPMETRVNLRAFDPANETEAVIAAVRSGQKGLGELLPALAEATLYVSSRAEVQPDGTGFEPLLLGEAATPLVAVFTSPERASLHRDRAEYLLAMSGDAFFRRLPPGFGAIVNPGYEAQFVVDAETLAARNAAAAAA